MPSSWEYVNTPTWSNALVADELAQLLDVRVGLAREADDEGRAERDAGNAVADAVEQRVVVWRVPGRFIRFSTGFDACCSGRSMYLQTFSHSAIAASVSSSIVVG